MSKLIRSTIAFAFAALASKYAFGQVPAPNRHTVINCVKVKDGKQAEFATYLKDISAKLYKSRVDAGEVAAYFISAAVAPSGRSARCDYRMVATYNGIPAEPGGGNLDRDLKRAGILMTGAEVTAKRDSLSFLVSRDIWRTRETVGTSVGKGGYVRVNYYKVHPGMTADYVTKETTGWKPLAEEINKQNAGRTWSLYTLVMPGGENLAYNAMTIDGFPSWEALMAGGSLRPTWNKVHPGLDSTAYLNQINSISDRVSIDVFRIVEAIRK